MTKKYLFFFWLALIGVCIGFYFANPAFFQPARLRQIFSDNLTLGLSIYLLLGTFRGLTLLPSTPLVLAGILVFPPALLFIINAITVLTSSSIVYYWGQFLGFDQYFNKRYPDQLKKLTQSLKQKEILVSTFWSFFPLVPTDLVCYASAVLRIRLWKCLLGVSIGEGIICAIYIFGGSALLAFIGPFR